MHSSTEESTEDNLPKPQKETGKQDDSPFDNSPDSSGQPGTGRTAYMGLLLGLALILSYVETLIPFNSVFRGSSLDWPIWLSCLVCICSTGKEHFSHYHKGLSQRPFVWESVYDRLFPCRGLA